MDNLRWRAVVAGVGGQGVLFATRVLAQAARERSEKVFISEVHGMAQRGGSVVSFLKAGDFGTPMMAEGWADLVFALEPGEAIRNLGYLAPDSHLVVNAPNPQFLSQEARSIIGAHGVRMIEIDATSLAHEAGTPKGANVVLLGASAASSALPFSFADLLTILRAITPPQRLQANEKLFSLGGQAGK